MKQGDPLGPLLFAAGIQDILVRVREAFPGVTVLAYLDDITLFGPPELVAEAFVQLQQELMVLGLQVNQAKCQLFYNSDKTTIIPDSFSDIHHQSTDFITILGCPMGTDERVKEEVNRIMEEYNSLLALVLQLPASIGYILLRNCINSKPIFLLRTILPVLTEEAIANFDDIIDRCLHILLKKADPFATIDVRTLDQVKNFEALPHQSSIVRSLPTSDGGIGIRKGSNINGVAWTSSYLTSLRWFSDKLPSILDLLPEDLLSDTSPYRTHL